MGGLWGGERIRVLFRKLRGILGKKKMGELVTTRQGSLKILNLSKKTEGGTY